MPYVVVIIALFFLIKYVSEEHISMMVTGGFLLAGVLVAVGWIKKQNVTEEAGEKLREIVEDESNQHLRDKLSIGLLSCTNDPKCAVSNDWDRLLRELYSEEIKPMLKLPSTVWISDWSGIHDKVRCKLDRLSRQIAQDRRDEYESFDRDQIRNFVDQHRSALVAKKRRFVERDEFGRELRGRWESSLAEVFDDVVLPNLYIRNLQNRADKIQWIDQLVVAADTDAPVRGFSNDMAGHDYEAFCAQCFEAAGAEVLRTPPSGDDGADLIIVSEDGRRIAVQCKRQGKPVGNRAVQEVSAALKMYEAQEGVVISASGYTKSARRTAVAHAVRLLHHDEIPSFIRDLLDT